MKIAEEECDETLYWMELLIKAGEVKPVTVNDIMSEANQLVSMIVASIKTARSQK